nr:hypothetical protein [Tanacetum cinerariifolium]
GVIPTYVPTAAPLNAYTFFINTPAAVLALDALNSHRPFHLESGGSIPWSLNEA